MAASIRLQPSHAKTENQRQSNAGLPKFEASLGSSKAARCGRATGLKDVSQPSRSLSRRTWIVRWTLKRVDLRRFFRNKIACIDESLFGSRHRVELAHARKQLPEF